VAELKAIPAMRYPLNIAERIHLIAILPLEGDVTTLRIVRELRESLSLTEEEHRDFGVTTEERDDQITYKWGNVQAAMTPREMEFRPKALAIIVETLKRLNQTKRLRAELLPLYEMFVDEKE
jgi:hypothetical protein